MNTPGINPESGQWAEPTQAEAGEDAWVDDQVEQLAEAWSRGQRTTAAELLALNPDVDEEAALRLVFEEVSLRRDAGGGGIPARWSRGTHASDPSWMPCWPATA